MRNDVPGVNLEGWRVSFFATPRSELHGDDGVVFRKSAQHIDPARRWRWSSTQLEPGELRVDSTTLDLDNALLGGAAINRLSLHFLHAPADSISLLMRSRNAGALFVGGYELTQDRCLRIDSGAEVELIAHQGSACLLISLRKSLLTHEAGTLQPNVTELRPHVGLVACSIDAGVALEDHVRVALQRDCSHRDATAAERVQRLATQLLLGPAERISDPATPSAKRLERARRRAAVELARRYIREHLTDPMQLADLCSNTHLQARSLEYGFREVVRLSPMRYVRMLRLGEVRRQLLKDACGQRNISEIALDAGFSHLSQFAVDYKKVFAETPSATRRRALTGVLDADRPKRRPKRAGATASSAQSAAPWVARSVESWPQLGYELAPAYPVLDGLTATSTSH